jgi:hypothetical protein
MPVIAPSPPEKISKVPAVEPDLAPARGDRRVVAAQE